jgi:hypothetical protein
MRCQDSRVPLIRALPRLVHLTPVLIGLVVASPAEGQWPIKEFEVLNVEPLRDLSSGGNAVAEYLDDLIVELARISPWDFEAHGGRTVPLDPDTKAKLEDHLSKTAYLLESWGFPAPRLQPVVETEDGRKAYRVFLVSGLGEDAGNYHHPICWRTRLGVLDHESGAEAIIRLDAEDVLSSMGTGSGIRGPGALKVLSHELFHAVEWATPFYEGAACEGVVGGWITEGAADAIGYDVVRTLGIAGQDDSDAWGARSYSRPLALPSAYDTEAMKNYRYTTSSFWRYLAEFEAIGRAPGPAPGPVDYHSLSSFLSGKPAARDCVEAGDPCDAELEYLHEWLSTHYPGDGLRDIYPRFVGVFAQYGAHRLSAALGGETPEDRNLLWNNWGFRSGCEWVELKNAPDGLRQEGVFSLRDVAAECWEIRPQSFGHPVAVEIEVRGERREGMLRQLLGVDARGGSASSGGVTVDTAFVVPDHRGGFRSLWVLPFEDGAATPFLLANVAKTPWLTRPLQDLTITFTALEPFATITSINSTPGPSGADVDQPTEVRFDRGLQGVVTDVADLYPHDPGLAEPCILRVQGLSNSDGDQLAFGMDLEGPISPSEYPVANGSQVEYQGRDPWPPGMPVVHFGLGPGNPLSGGAYQAFLGTAGTLTLTSVSGRFVQGILDVSGENRLAKRIAMGDPPPPVYVPNATIRVEFGLVMRDPGDPVNDSGVVGCLMSGGGGGRSTPGSTGPVSGPASGPPSDTAPSSKDPSDESGDTRSGGAGGAPVAGGGGSGPDSADAPADEAESAGRPSEAAGNALGPGETRWVSVRAEGRPDLSFRGSDLDGSAGAQFSCFGTAGPASVSLFNSASGQTATLGMNVVTTAGIAEGATGTFRIDQVQFIVGGGSLDWQGPVNLEISRQNASKDPGARRVMGRIVGLSVVDRETRAVIPIEAEFDVNAACAPFGRTD